MPQYSSITIAWTLADMLDMPVREVLDNLQNHLDVIDTELEREIDLYLDFANLNQC